MLSLSTVNSYLLFSYHLMSFRQKERFDYKIYGETGEKVRKILTTMEDPKQLGVDELKILDSLNLRKYVILGIVYLSTNDVVPDCHARQDVTRQLLKSLHFPKIRSSSVEAFFEIYFLWLYQVTITKQAKSIRKPTAAQGREELSASVPKRSTQGN